MEGDEFYLLHPHMPLSERAKIFIPFEPLRGFRAALAERERLANRTERREMTDEQRMDVSLSLSSIAKGDLVRVIHYQEGAYAVCVGHMTRLDLIEGALTVAALTVAAQRIPLPDILEIGLLDEG